MRHLPVLPARDAVDEIEIASPCSIPWDSMRGDQRVRFCQHCRQNVYNIEALSRPEARRLIEARERRACVRILRRTDGTVVTADCWTRLRAARRKGILAFVALLVIVGWSELWAVRFGWLALQRLRAPRPVTAPAPAPSPAPAAARLQPPSEHLAGKPIYRPLMGVPPIYPRRQVGHTRVVGRVRHRS